MKTSKEVFPFIDEEGNIHMIEQMVDLDPLLFMGKGRLSLYKAFNYRTRKRFVRRWDGTDFNFEGEVNDSMMNRHGETDGR